MRIVFEDEEALEKAAPCLFILEPHDLLPLSIFAFNDCIINLKGHKLLGCITSACFHVPFMRQIYTWVNAVSVDEKNLHGIISQGISPVICPGGVQESALLAQQKNVNDIVLYLMRRRGFVRMALKHGRPLVPCFSYGLRDSFDFIGIDNKLIIELGRRAGGLPLLFFGVGGIPFGPPKSVQYSNVIGKPIHVPRIENPSAEDVDKYHSIFLKAMQDLFEATKEEFGGKDLQLQIV